MKNDLKNFTAADLEAGITSPHYTEDFKIDLRAERDRRFPKRWFDVTGTTRGRDGREIDNCREYARTADEAMTQAVNHAAGTRFTPESVSESPHNPKEI